MTFEAELAARLRDLADSEHGWDDPIPAVLALHEQAATAAPGGPTPAASTPTAPGAAALRTARRLHLLPYLAVAAVLLAVAVGIGAIVVHRGGGSSSSGALGASQPESTVGGKNGQSDVTGTPGGASTTPGAQSNSRVAGCGPGPTTATPAGWLLTVAASDSSGSVTVDFAHSQAVTAAEALPVLALLRDGRVVGRTPVTGGIRVSDFAAGTQRFTVSYLSAIACGTAAGAADAALPAGAYQLVAYVEYTAGERTDTVVSSAIEVDLP